jgi:kynurenine formamidase
VNGVFYNGNRAEDFVTMSGLKRLGAEHIPPIVTRAMLLDMVALKGRRLNGSEVIMPADVEAALKRQNLPQPETGDVILLHTGWMEHWRLQSDLYWKEEPGSGIETARWLAQRGVVAVGNDTSRLEADPFEQQDLFFPVHQILLAENGVYILENINTQALIDANGTAYPFLLMISPLPIVGASQTWITPIALL